MTISVQISIQIARPSDEIFAYIADFENNPAWQSGMVAARFTTEGPLRIGSTYSQEARFLGRPVISEFEVIAYEPGRIIKARSTAGSFPITFTRRVEPVEGGTQVTAIVEGDASGFFRLAEPLLARMVQRSVERDYRQLKHMLEAG